MPANRIALITGANQGMGKQVAKELVSDGVTVFVGCRDLARGVQAAAEIGDGAMALQLDVTDAASIASVAERIRDEAGRLDLLVNNAAISTVRTDIRDMAELCDTAMPSVVSLDEVRAVWEVNVFGALAVYQAMLPLLRESSDARIVNVTSAQGSLTTMADRVPRGGAGRPPRTERAERHLHPLERRGPPMVTEPGQDGSTRPRSPRTPGRW
ncbi:SDR family NAD(P)-dependent oxidoreductase [Pseudonocardia sichuanensis]